MNWLFFYTAASEIEKRIGVSGGVAQRMLREACASGDVRSKQLVPRSGEWQYEPVKPSEWVKDQMDLEWQRRDDVVDASNAEADLEPDPDDIPGPVGVYVNGDDFRYWLDKLNPPQKSKPALGKGGKVPLIIEHLKGMYPQGVPDPVHCPRKALKAKLVATDRRLEPLDEATLKSAIDNYNCSVGNDPN